MLKKTDHLIILATSDIHGNLTGYDFADNYTAPDGMARLYTYVRQLRASENNVLLIDGGDMIGGSILLSDICPQHKGEVHPVMEAMNLLGYDAAVVGNHDFDMGTDYCKSVFSQADFPVLGANVREADGKLFTGKSYTVIERGGVRVAVIGVVTPFVSVSANGAPGVSELRFTPGADAVTETLKEIEGQYDVLAVSAHMGGFGEFDIEKGSDSAWHIADVVPETDILQMAHTHVIDIGKRGSTVYGEVRNKLRELLRFDVTLGEDGRPTYTQVRVVSLEDYAPAAEITELPSIVHAVRETEKYISAGMPQNSDSPVIGQAAETFQPKNREKGVPIARMQATPLAELINRVQLEFSGADLSACCLTNPDGNLRKGPITERGLRDVYMFENFLVKVNITAGELKNYLEKNAECYETVTDEQPKLRLNPNFPPFQQDYFSGVSYEIHVRNKPGDRIRNMMVHGRPVRDDQVFSLTVHNFRYSTLLKKDGIIAGDKVWQSENTIREMMKDYISRNSPIWPKTEENWKVIL